MMGVPGRFYQDIIRTGCAVIMAIITGPSAVTPAVIGQACSFASPGYGNNFRYGLRRDKMSVIFVVHQRTMTGFAVRTLGQCSLGKGCLMVNAAGRILNVTYVTVSFYEKVCNAVGC
jgi:hypothetical protein